MLGLGHGLRIRPHSYREVDQDLARCAAHAKNSLGKEKPLDVFALAKRYPFEHFVDATLRLVAAFVPVGEPAGWSCGVSTTGLLIRPALSRSPRASRT
jgi:hypothetical protein